MDATGVIDEVINQHSAVSISIWILVFAAIVVIIVLGLEFWRNFFGMLGSPALTFQRMMGEVSIPPAIFVVIVAGFFMAVILLAGWTDDVTGDAVVARFDVGFDWMAEKSMDAGDILPEQIDFLGWFKRVQRDVAAMLSFFVLMPIGCLLVWGLGGVGFHFASIVGGNKGGASIGGLLAASSYIYLPVIMVILFGIKYIYAGWFNTVLLVIFGLYSLFLWVVLMREYGRFNYVKSIISFIIGFVFTAILVTVAVLGVFWIVALIMNYM